MNAPFSPLNLVLFGALALAAIAGFLLVPESASLPVHWNVAGEADGFLPRNLALLLPLLLALVVAAVFYFIGSRPSAAAGNYVLGAALSAILGLFVVIEIATVMIGVGVALDMVRIICFSIGVLMLVLGNVMPKSQPNSFAGLRIPTTLHDPANWQATHRLAGRLFMAGGVVLIVAAIFIPASLALLGVLIAALLVPLLVGTVYSISMARRAG